MVLTEITRIIDPSKARPNVLTIDKHGRAVGVGRRKESTARAFVVEGNGEILVNGKPLSQAFGRVHDRESAVWALTSTQRLDKYNVWALVEGGGTTGQAEALTLAVAKGLLAHEPALKPTLRKGQFLRFPFTLAFIIFWSRLLFFTLTSAHSWLRHSRFQGSGEEEARPRQGSQVPGLGQALRAVMSTSSNVRYRSYLRQGGLASSPRCRCGFAVLQTGFLYHQQVLYYSLEEQCNIIEEYKVLWTCDTVALLCARLAL